MLPGSSRSVAAARCGVTTLTGTAAGCERAASLRAALFSNRGAIARPRSPASKSQPSPCAQREPAPDGCRPGASGADVVNSRFARAVRHVVESECAVLRIDEILLG